MTTSLASPRLYAAVLACFSVFALVIAAVGLFGVLSFNVAQRTREIGIRSAVGAQTRDIVSVGARQAVSIVITGVAVGLATAGVIVRLLSALLYGISPYDAFTFIAVPIVIALVALAACLVPAHRAATLDPLATIRCG